MTIRLLLIDDHMLFREMAARALAGEPDVEVVGNTASVEQALRLLGDTLPDVVLLDYDLNGRSGIDFVRASRRKGFGGHILIVSAAIPDSDLRQALREGA